MARRRRRRDCLVARAVTGLADAAACDSVAFTRRQKGRPYCCSPTGEAARVPRASVAGARGIWPPSHPDASDDALLMPLRREGERQVTALDEELLEQYHRALGALVNGNPDVYKSMLSQREDVTLANPFGPVARGRTAVEERLERAASNYRDGELTGFEQVAKYELLSLRTSWRSSASRPRSAEGRRSPLTRLGPR